MFIILEFGEAIASIGAIIGIVLWLILIVFGRGIADQGTVIANFIISCLLLIFAIIEIICLLKNKKKWMKILGIIESILIVAFMIYGFIHTYNNIFFHYSFTKIPSIIHTTWPICLIINLINMKINDSDTKIGELLLATFSTFVLGFFLGQVITGVLTFTTGLDNTENIYNKIAYYHNKEYEKDRGNIKSTLEGANIALENAKKDLLSNNKDISGEVMKEYITTKEFWNNYLEIYGYSLYKRTDIDENNVKYRITDKITGHIDNLCFNVNENKFIEYNETEN